MSRTLPSRSELEATACLFRLNAIYNEGVVDDSDEARRGSIVHDAVRLYIQKLLPARLPSDAGFALEAFAEASRLRAAAPAVVDEARDLFFDRFASRFEFNPAAYFMAEERQAVHDVSFMPDLVYVFPTEIEIHDWKTHYVGFDDAQARRENQAKVYALQAMAKWPGFAVYKVTFHFIRIGITATAIFTPADRPELEEHLQRQIDIRAKAYETNEWPASVGSHCAYCRLKCPIADNDRRQPLRAKSMFEAQAMASRKIAIDTESAALGKALSGFAAIDGPIRVGDLELAHRPTVRKTWPAVKVLAALEDNGVEEPLLPMAVIPSGKLAKYFKAAKWKHIAAALAGLAIEKASSTFSAKKVGGIEADLDDDNEEAAS